MDLENMTDQWKCGLTNHNNNNNDQFTTWCGLWMCFVLDFIFHHHINIHKQLRKNQEWKWKKWDSVVCVILSVKNKIII